MVPVRLPQRQLPVRLPRQPSPSARYYRSRTRKQPQLCSLFLLSSLEKFQTHAHFMPRRPRASRSFRQKSEARSKFILHIYPNSHCLWSATDLVRSFNASDERSSLRRSHRHRAVVLPAQVCAFRPPALVTASCINLRRSAPRGSAPAPMHAGRSWCNAEICGRTLLPVRHRRTPSRCRPSCIPLPYG